MTVERLSRLREQTDSILVALSGGKDALAVLDLCCRYIPRVECYYMYLVSGLETFEAPVDAACRRHNVVVHKVPHWDLARLIKHSVLRPHTRGASDLRELRLRDVESALRERTGISWIATGERATDSFNRRFFTSFADGVNAKLQRTYPIHDWLDRDVYAYLRARDIEPPKRFGFVKNRSSGFALTGQCLAALRDTNPADFAKVLRVFPYAKSEIIKHEQRQRERCASGCEQISNVHGEADSPIADQERAVQPTED